MSLDNLGNEQTIILHICETTTKKIDLVLFPHKQSIGYVRTKRQTLKRKNLSYEKQITRRGFSKQRNAFSESETSHLEQLYTLIKSVIKNYQTNDTLFFSDSETTPHSSMQGKRRIKNTYKTNHYVYTIGINQLNTLKITN